MTARRIDVHHHVLPDSYLRALKRADVRGPLTGVAFPHWDVAEDIALMERQGIQTAIVSITAPGVGFASTTDAPRIARETNESLAQLVEEFGARYGAFALMPLPDVEATLREIDYALDVLGLDGIGLFTNHKGIYLGDPAFERIFAKLAELGALVHIHPAVPPATNQPGFGLPPSLLEFTFDTTRAVANLLYSGTLDRFPNLRMIISHAGGAVPYLAQRLAYAATINPALTPREPRDLVASLRRLYYDTAMSANPHTLAALTSLVTTDHILFGSDYPFMPESTTAETSRGISAFFEAPDRKLIERDNALGLLPRLTRQGGAAASPPG